MNYPNKEELEEMRLIDIRRLRLTAFDEAEERIQNMRDSEYEVLKKRDDDNRFWQYFIMLLLVWRARVTARLQEQETPSHPLKMR